MKRIIILFCLSLVASCVIRDAEEQIDPLQKETMFYASFEQPDEAETRVYANENLHLRWSTDDRISIFNKNTYNQQYKFLGKTGDNSGEFSKVEAAEFVTGNSVPHVVSVFPYQESTIINENESITVTLPVEQAYAENTFGLDANTMVSISEDNFLLYKNVGGYLVIFLHGDGIAVSSITLRGNNGEKIAGKATIEMPMGKDPVVSMAVDAQTELTICSPKSIVLSSSPEKPTAFWFVLPPTSFEKGFTIIVKRKDGTVFTKETSSSITISRNQVSRMAPFLVEMEGAQPNNVVYYTSTDNNIIEPHVINTQTQKIISNSYVNGVGTLVFNSELTQTDHLFENCTNLSTIHLPIIVPSIGEGTFSGCTSLSSIIIPEGVTSIGGEAFGGCSSLTTIEIPKGVTSIGGWAFSGCSSLSSVVIPKGVTRLEDGTFYGCSNLESVVIPDGVTNIGDQLFDGCSSLTAIEIPKGVTSIGGFAFSGCSNLSSVTLLSETPPSLGQMEKNIGFFFYVPAGRILAYQTAWSDYADRIIEIGVYTHICYTSSDEKIVVPHGGIDDKRLISNTYTNGQGILTYAGELNNISNKAFMECETLTSIVIPTGIIGLGNEAFYGCSSLTAIEIPKGVTSIGRSAFYGCTALESISVLPSTPPTGGNNMFHQTNLCPIYIPAGSEDLYINADYWKQYALRMRIEGNDASIAYSSTDYSQDGKVVQLQQATVGRGIIIVFLGDGYLDRDMVPGGKYEMKMKEAMEQFFAYEPYYSFRDRFNIYYVKVVSKNDLYGDDASERKLTYEKNGSFYFLLDKSREYWEKVPNPYQQPMKVCTLLNTETMIGRSICWWLGNENVSAFVMDRVGPILNHEIGGHGFGLLWDEYVEKEETFLDQVGLDNNYINDGYGANVDWRSNPDEVRWAHLLKDSRYSHEGLGVYEGGYLYAHGVYRATENSMMRYNNAPFNAPSREQIYKFIMKYSEGDNWQYDYEEFVKADERGRMEAAEELGRWKSPQKRQVAQNREKYHCPPIVVDENVKAVGVDKDGNVIKVY